MASVIAAQKKDPLEQLARGLQIAQSAFGIYSDYKKLGQMSQAEKDAAAAKEDQANSIIDEPTKANLLTKFEPTEDPSKAVLKFNQKMPDGTTKPAMFALPGAKSAPARYSNVTTDEGVFAVNTANPNDKIRVGSKPKAPRLGSSVATAEENTVVPGFTLERGMKPSVTELKGARDALATYSTIASNLNELKGYVEKNGSFQYFGPDGARMKQIATMTRLQMKEMANLGVLSATDYKFLDSMLQDPGSAGALFTQNETAIAQIDELKKQTELKFLNGMMAKGFKLADQPEQVAAKQQERGTSFGPSATATAATASISREDALKELSRRGIQPQR